MTDEPRYDVAFSFLSAHEALALRISDGLTDRLTTFVYSLEQPEVIGRNTDGVEAFTNIFRYESRVCVVLHSEGWGKSGYTHIEEAAIKDRALGKDGGWDFLIVVCVDDAKPPKWIPEAKIWYGYAKYGLEGLLATIDNRVTELGGRPKQDSLLERAARSERERDFEKRKRDFASSPAGFKSAQAEVARLSNLLDARVQQLTDVSPSLGLQFDENENARSVAATSPKASFVLYWQPQFGDTLEAAALLVVEWGGRFSYTPGWGGGPPRLDKFSVVPTIDYANRVAWQVPTLTEPLSSEALLDHLFDRLLDRLSPRPDAPFLVALVPRRTYRDL
jgi:hypothetical protein